MDINIHPLGAVFWLCVIGWIAWKIKRYFDNQSFIKKVTRDAQNTYEAMTPEQKRAEDQRYENSIKLPVNKPEDTAFIKIVIGVIVAIIIYQVFN